MQTQAMFVVVVFSFLGTGAVAQDSASSETEKAKKGQDTGQSRSEEREASLLAQRLITELTDANTKLEVARERVKKVEDISRRIEEKVRAEGLEGDTAITATSDLRKILEESLERLRNDAVKIKDQVRKDALPLYKATTAKMQARLSALDPGDPHYKQMQEIVDKAVENQSYASTELRRLEGNIGLLNQVLLEMFRDRDLMDQWKKVNLEGKKLIEKLREFNDRIEEIYRMLMRSPA